MGDGGLTAEELRGVGHLSADDVRGVRFNKPPPGKRGYDEQQVDTVVAKSSRP